jgi:hypothetical protein
VGRPHPTDPDLLIADAQSFQQKDPVNIQPRTNAVLTGLTALVMLVLGSGCTPQPDQRPDAERVAGEHQELMKWRSYWTTPIYGEERPISGKAAFGREARELALCSEPRDRCTMPINVDGSEHTCWLEFTDAAIDAETKLLHGKSMKPFFDEYWLEGTGRIALFPGSFGNGGYTCQVQVSSLRVFEHGSPWFWGPPSKVD